MTKKKKWYFARYFLSAAIILVLAYIILKGQGVNPPVGSGSADKVIENLKLLPGFKASIYAKNIENARSLTMGASGTLFVGTRKAGNVYAIVDSDKDYVGDKVYTIAKNLFMPCGVAFKDGSLYVAEVNRVLRYDNIEQSLQNPPKPVVINDSFPKKEWHGWKFIAFGPDNKLYVPVGAPCNVCESKDPRFASIMRINPDGTNPEIFASGVRNTVGFDWHPQTDELWFTENGRDWMGDNLPPDELNHAPKSGMHFGFPYFHGDQIPDPEFSKGKKAENFVPCIQALGPHVAALGMRFCQSRQFPASYTNCIFIAEHGSWNRSKKIGYRITMLPIVNNKPTAYKVFLSGFKTEEKVWGRPADLMFLDDGSMLISDDFADAIYRISFEQSKQN